METQVVRKLMIQGRSEGLDRLSSDLDRVTASQKNVGDASARMQASMRATSDAMLAAQRSLGQVSAANDNVARSFAEIYAGISETKTGFISAAEQTLHVASEFKLLAVAAYALSPAVRSVANTVGSNLLSALGAVAPAAASAATAIGSRFVAALAPVAAASAPFVALAFAAAAAFKLFEYGGQKIEEFTKLLEQANASGVSADFFQRMAKGAEELSSKADSATAALKKFNEVSQPQLGGSTIGQRINQLVGYGNFANNAGVQALSQATSTEERYRSIVSLITQAMEQGERLAALDIAAKFLPPDMLDKLRASGDYLQRLQQTADQVKPVDLVSQEQIARAADLKKRYDDAVAVLSQQWIPFQQTLIDLGFKMQGAWITIVEAVAAAATAVGNLINSLQSMPGWFVKLLSLGGSGVVGALTGAVPGLGAALGGINLLGGSDVGQQTVATGELAAAQSRLAAGLRTTGAVEVAMRQTTEAYTKTLGDNSKAVNDNAKAVAAQRDFWDRATEAIEKNILTLQADIATIGQNAGATAHLRAEFQLLEAAKNANRGVTEEQIVAYVKLRQTMEADQALQAAGIKLSEQERQFLIEKPRLLGELIRVQEALRTAQSLTTDFATSFARDMMHGVSATQALTNAVSRLADQLIEIATKQLVNQAFGALFGAFFGGGGGVLTGTLNGVGSAAIPIANGAAFDRGNIVPFARGGIVNSPTIFPMASGYGLMGEAGPEAVMPLRRGSDGRLGVAAANGNSAGGSAITINNNVSVTMPQGAQLGDGDRFGKEVARVVGAEVRAVIIREKRAGGLLTA